MRKWIEAWYEWLEETHSLGFELRRHFFLRFFDSDLVSTPGQWQVVAGGAFGAVASLSFLFGQAYFGKYRRLLEFDSPEPYQMAAMADYLFLVCISIVFTSIITALQWPSLFPGLRDYLALAGLPIRPRQIFSAKFAALVAFVGMFVLAVNLLPSVILPAVMAGRYASPMFWGIVSLILSTMMAGAFTFFVLVALQGVLLNIVPSRRFPGVSLFVQGGLLLISIGVTPLVLGVPFLSKFMNQRPDYMWNLPPVWFLGLQQVILGSGEDSAWKLARIAIAAVALSAAFALAAYVWSYKKQRVRVLESPGAPQGGEGVSSKLGSLLLDRWLRDPRERAIFSFVATTLGRSRQHRMVLTIFAAIAAALLVPGVLSIAFPQSLARKALALREAAAAAPLVLTLFGLAGFRYLFRLPVELRANWMFRINGISSLVTLLRGVDRFVLTCAIAPALLFTAPLGILAFGWFGGIGAFLLAALPALILRDMLWLQHHQIPFTSAYLPAKRPVVETLILYGIAMIVYVSILGSITAASAREGPYFLIEFGCLLALWARVRRARLESWQTARLDFEELAEPVVVGLQIEKD